MNTSETDGNDDDRRLSLIDISSADDSLIGNPFHHQHSEMICTSNLKDEFDDAATKINEWEREPRPIAIENTKCNLRQSLAWDTAFFTSPGFLEPEELSSMIVGVGKGDKQTSSLPAIQEDVKGSCESISTFKSNNSLIQEGVEDDLFQDVRASIQNFSRMSDAARLNREVLPRFHPGGSSKAVGMASYKKVPSSKSPSAGMQSTRKLPKKNPISPHLSRKPVARREEPCISKQLKTLGKSSPSSTISSNRSSIGDLHVKSEKDRANNKNCGKVNSVMNTTVVKGSQVNGLKPITLSKSSLGRPLATKAKSTICSSSSSNLACNISKSPSNSLKRKVDAGTKTQPSSCSVVRTPSRIASRDKIRSSNSSLSDLVSVTKFSSSISPASSISDRSSESSSPSTSMTKVRSNSSRTIFHSSSSKKHLPGNNARHVLNSQKSHTGSCLEGKETRNAGSISQRVRGATAAEKVLTHSPKKPLGLRQPSPKIGFFEGVKPSVCNPRGRMQPHTTVSQGRVSPSIGQNKAKLGKLHTASQHVETMEVQSQMHLKTYAGDLDANNTMVEGHLIGANDLKLGFTQEESCYDDQVDCLSRQVELIDINLKTQT
ncbi:unnamed protein product [Lathyrus oleraceus]|uniref:Uncharacterized protein n=1 Tax=Pisum sativum TaxID=3888 RepID=A0A9D4W3U4_PEA|nr:uncharacterized protein LOC127098659 [Pisum sativum]KAI5395563.1 hypothetical protein KIW84_061930 [Pisum sativum]